MDTTNQNLQGNGQTVGQQPAQTISSLGNVQTPQSDSAQPLQQSTNMPPIPQPVASADPNTLQSQPVQQVPGGSSRITLQDLYGPSGMAEGKPVQEQLSQPFLSQMPSQAVPVPVSPTQTSVQQSIPVPNPIQNQQPVQNSGQTSASFSSGDTMTAEQSAQAVESNQPVAAPQPNVPTIPDLPTSGSERSVQSSSQETDVPADMPLRKQATETVMPQENPSGLAQNSSDTPPPENEKKKSFLNKFLLLRILFGGLAVVIFMVVILFVVQFFSNFSLSPSTSGKVTLTYWGLWEDPNTMQSVISQFESENPNITVQYQKEDPKDYSERLLTRIQNGSGPDIFTYHSSWLPMIQQVLTPLPTTVVSKNTLEKEYYPVVRNDVVKNGALYGVPLGIDTLSLFINNTLLQSAKLQVPTTWDNFIVDARAMTVKDASGKITTAGAALGTFDNITHAPDILATLFMQNGVDITTMTPSSNAADALSFYTSFATGDSNVWDTTLDPSQLAFARGNLAMYFGYSWDIFLIKAANPSLDFSVHSIPHLPGRNITAASYWVDGVSTKSTHQKEALLFMQFLTQKNTLATLYAEEAKTRLFGEPYPLVSLGNTLKDNPLVYPFVSQAQDAKSSFFAGETEDSGLNGQMNAYLGNAVRGALGNTSAQSAIDTLTQGVVQIEKQYAGS